MADVFISYAHDDKEQARKLAEEIRATGLTVWWDRDLLPAQDWRKVIQQEIDDAHAVVVLWTPRAVKSDFVAEEAEEGQHQRKFVPAKIGECRPPIGFRRHQHQDLTDWRGDGAALEFKKLAIQLVAFARGQEAADALPPLESPEPIRLEPATKPAPKEISGLGRWLNGLLVVGVIACLIAAYRDVTLKQFVGSYWAWVITLAVSAVALFRAAEYALPEGPKALVSRWLAGEKSFTSSEAFLTMFEGVFGRRHWSWFTLSRSIIATLVVYLAFLALFIDFDRLWAQAQTEGAWKPNIAGDDWDLKRRIENSALLLLGIVPLVNIVADYLSLWQTRKVLQWSTSWLPLWLGVVFDAVLTGAVFLALLPLGPAIAIFCADGKGYVAFSQAAFEQAVAFAPEVWRGLWMIFEGHPLGEIDTVLAAEASLSTTTLLIALATTFITSVWLWFALLAAPLFWLIAAGTRRGAGWLGRLTGASRRPILWLGYGAAAIVLVIGASWQEAAKALQTAQKPKPFRDCDRCPWMVAIPGGTFLMGSPKDEEGRASNEGPQQEIKIKPFAMGVYEVTFREWDACVAANSKAVKYCRPIKTDAGWGRGLRPVINVSWEDITGKKKEKDGYLGFLAWMNTHAPKGYRYRLPSEAEWEYATRAGSKTAYWWGKKATFKDANFNDRSRGEEEWFARASWSGHLRGQTLPVGAFKPNPFGLYDVHGNVYEWVEDCWNSSLEGRPRDGSARRNGDCSAAVLRGGSWSYIAEDLRSAVRGGSLRHFRNADVGFRLARTKVE
ncbi:MAG: SUMF1/EgtB/PvdO family nonheme iron enzyme [Neomegalonema sp.]|nr:SUMF1/EgtB/PvdO family nonheme iron enzyme [Neomegalonema sp.]